MFIRKKKVQHHITQAIERQRRIDEKHQTAAMDRQRRHYEQLIAHVKDEYEAILETQDRQINALKKDAQDNEHTAEMIRFGAKSNHRIASELVSWSERFMKTGAEAFQEINCICDEAGASVRKLEWRVK